jgi:hypothetical protein
MPPTDHNGELVLPAFGVVEPERVLAQDELFAVARDKFSALLVPPSVISVSSVVNHI